MSPPHESHTSLIVEKIESQKLGGGGGGCVDL